VSDLDPFEALAPPHELIGHARLQRTRSVQGDERYHVLDPLGLQIHDEPPHPCRLELEHPARLSTGEHRVGLGVIHRDVLEPQLDAVMALDGGQGVGHHRQGLEPEEIELLDPHVLEGIHFELGRDRLVVRYSE